MQELRDNFLLAIINRFPQLDLDEIYEILNEFKQPFIALTQQMDNENEYSTVTEPWNFDRLRQLLANRTQEPPYDMQMIGIQTQQSLPNMARLSLEEKKGTETTGGSARNNQKPGQ